MKLNKKYIKHLLIFQCVGVIGFITMFILDKFNINDIHNYQINGLIYAVSALFCICYYAFIYNAYIGRNTLKECVFSGAMYFISVIEIIFSLTTAGIHTGIIAVWGASLLSITVYTVISYLRVLEEDLFITQRKYTAIIKFLKSWANAVFISEFFVGIAVVFYPQEFIWF